jgi:hypothetical protein
MGASSWVYAVDYQPDTGAALEALRRQVFDAGDYFPRSVNPDYAAVTGRQPMEANPPSIDDLLETQAEEGTHSILDICDGISAEQAFGTASPLSAEQSLAAFGTVRPDCARIEEWLAGGAYFTVRERWSGVYVICYRNDQPHQIHFAGFSGD